MSGRSAVGEKLQCGNPSKTWGAKQGNGRSKEKRQESFGYAEEKRYVGYFPIAIHVFTADTHAFVEMPACEVREHHGERTSPRCQ